MIMKMKNCFIIVSLMIYSATVLGNDVSQSLAIDVATQYYERVKNDIKNEQVNKIKSTNRSQSNRVPELISPLGLACMWLVPVEDGWILVSTNTKTTPILAHYQTDQKPVYSQLAPEEKFLLAWYEKIIARANDSCPECKQNRKWDLYRQHTYNSPPVRRSIIISPLTKTKWGQVGNNEKFFYYCSKAYNKFCPWANNSELCYKSPVGCVAVAMAQIMAYWKWPYIANIPTTPGGSTKEKHLYDWSQMPDSLLNSTPLNEADMVAGFLKDCGYALNMSYGDSSSSSLSISAYSKFIEFGYNKDSISWHLKEPTSNWEDKIKYELNMGRPVFYSGTPDTFDWGGHAFVVDGYNSENKFHLNLGWKGSYNRFYSLDSISDEDWAYNHWHYAIWGIQPDPACTNKVYDSTFNPDSIFCIATGGYIEMNGCILENIKEGVIISSNEVRLTNGFTIKAGSKVRISIEDVPCSSPTKEVNPLQKIPMQARSTQDNERNCHATFAISPNPVRSILHIQTPDEHSLTKIYAINGQCVQQSVYADIDVSALPQGMYILRALTADGQLHQAKFIKQ